MADPEREPTQRDEVEAALAELLEAAALLVAGVVWSPEALPMAERLSAAVTRFERLVTDLPTAPVGSEG